MDLSYGFYEVSLLNATIDRQRKGVARGSQVRISLFVTAIALRSLKWKLPGEGGGGHPRLLEERGGGWFLQIARESAARQIAMGFGSMHIARVYEREGRGGGGGGGMRGYVQPLVLWSALVFPGKPLDKKLHQMNHTRD